jgi:hypothetical protein
MEIHVLRMSISDKDLNDLIDKHLRQDQPVDELKVQISSDGVRLKGVYPLFVNVSFETHWELGVRGGKATARLAGFRALGIPGNIFKSAILKLVADAAHRHPGLEIDNDTVVLDLERLCQENGLTARINLTGVTCQDGILLLEAGNPA